MNKVIKVCINPQCEEVAHNCPKKESSCRNCDSRLIEIDLSTYRRKYSKNFFQYDYGNGELTNPTKMGYSIQTEMFI